MVGFRATVTAFHAPETVKLPLKDAPAGDATAVIPFDKLVSQVPELSNGSRFLLNPLYWCGDLQTIGFSVADYSKVYQVYYGRRVLTREDGATISADYVLPKPDNIDEFKKKAEINQRDGWPKMHPRTRFLDDDEIKILKSGDTKPILIINHGLGGGSHEPYCRAMAEKATQIGFDAVVLHARGCGRSKISTPELFNALATDDLRFFLKQLRADYPNRPFYGVGFSFGATLLANYLGEESAKSEYTATALLSNPWDLADSAYHIGTRFWSKLLFLKPITETLTRLVKSNRQELVKDPFYTEEKINGSYDSPLAFDTVFTAPLFGFNSAFEYYRLASSVNRIFRIKTPTLVINAYDDPVVGVHSIPLFEAQANPYIHLLRTDLGGHIAYVRPNGSLWAVDKIAEYFEKYHATVDETKKVESDYVPSTNRYAARLRSHIVINNDSVE